MMQVYETRVPVCSPKELRDALNKAGIEHTEARGIAAWEAQGIVAWKGDDGCDCFAYATKADDGTTEYSVRVTGIKDPKQAIAITAGTRTCEWCKDGTFDRQTVMMTNHGWQKIRHCPNCGKRIVKED